MAWTYYNEIDPFAAQWLRNLMAAGHIAGGEVDERSIADVRPDDLRGFNQCHFFAGIGVWSYALRLAGWPDDRQVWTGSCPCQPFSSAGSGGGFNDGRHHWPNWQRLIVEHRPVVVFGEQVASPAGLAWFDFVSADLEIAGYAVGAADLCAAGVGAPHIRQRLFFVADTGHASRRPHGRQGHDLAWLDGLQQQGTEASGEPGDGSEAIELADAFCLRQPAGARPGGLDAPAPSLEGEVREQRLRNDPGEHGSVGDAERDGLRSSWRSATNLADEPSDGAVRGFWSDATWIACRDGKARPVKSGLEPLVDGAPDRVGRLRAYGNAIAAPVAAEFIGAYLECSAP